MHPHIRKLHTLAGKNERLIIGLMSGTSLDGLDVALCRLRGHGTETKASIVEFHTEPYDEIYRSRIRSVFARRNADVRTICLLNEWVGLEHARIVQDCLQRWGIESADVDLVASHGQTIYHSPAHLHCEPEFPNGTLQIGDADHIAYSLGIITCSDFRQKHLAAGGEGAPLAMYGDFLVFSSGSENRVLLNIGGIANITWLPAGLRPEDVISSDTGPGNTLMDAVTARRHPEQPYDVDARIARTGTVSAELLAALGDDPFFELALPKTTGPELFGITYLERAQARSGTQNLAHADVMATLNRFSADTIVATIRLVARDTPVDAIYASGGGIHNPLLMENLAGRRDLPKIRSVAALGIDPDAKEALLFAILANECVAAEHAYAFGGTERFGGANAGAVSMGKISFPD